MMKLSHIVSSLRRSLLWKFPAVGLSLTLRRHAVLHYAVQSQEKGEMSRRLTKSVSLGDIVELVASNAKPMMSMCAKLCHKED